jgi:acyl-CoA synthetase (AMP-forming)/AMP-acid ligase II/acyl carrier protein
MSNQRMIQTAMEHPYGLVMVSWLPFYHDMGLIGNLMQPLFMGGRGVFISPVSFLQKPIRWLEAISNFRANTSGAPNFAYKLCARTVTAEEKRNLDLSELKVLYSGSEPIDAKILEEFAVQFRDSGLRREALYPCYGMAETTLLATGSRVLKGPVYETLDADALALNIVRPSDPQSRSTRVLVGCGRAVVGQDLRIVDPQAPGGSMGDGQIGEIWIRGPHVAAGYWEKPELTNVAFSGWLGDEGPFLRTGDLGYLRDGELFVTGRIKDLIIIRGRNHYPHDVESTVELSHPALALSGAAAFSTDEDGEERLVVVAEVKRSMLRSLAPDDVVAAIRRAIFEEYELNVHSIVLIRPATLPRTSSGKVQRRACRAAYLRDDLDTVAASRLQTEAPAPFDDSRKPQGAPETAADIEWWTREWVSARLGVDASAVDPDRPFVELGLDSASGVALAAALSSWLGRDVSPTLVWDHPTIRLAAEHFAPPLAAPVDGAALDEAAQLLILELASLRAEGQT